MKKSQEMKLNFSLTYLIILYLLNISNLVKYNFPFSTEVLIYHLYL